VAALADARLQIQLDEIGGRRIVGRRMGGGTGCDDVRVGNGSCEGPGHGEAAGIC